MEWDVPKRVCFTAETINKTVGMRHRDEPLNTPDVVSNAVSHGFSEAWNMNGL